MVMLNIEILLVRGLSIEQELTNNQDVITL